MTVREINVIDLRLIRPLDRPVDTVDRFRCRPAWLVGLYNIIIKDLLYLILVNENIESYVAYSHLLVIRC